MIPLIQNNNLLQFFIFRCVRDHNSQKAIRVVFGLLFNQTRICELFYHLFDLFHFSVFFNCIFSVFVIGCLIIKGYLLNYLLSISDEIRKKHGMMIVHVAGGCDAD